MSALGWLYALAWTALCLFLVLFLSRRLTRFAVRQEERRPGAMAGLLCRASRILFVTGLLYFSGHYGCHLVQHGPPQWVDRIGQRKLVRQRVEEIGGWTNLVTACAVFAATNQDAWFRFYPRHEQHLVLPPALAAMKPREIEGDNREGLKTLTLRLFGQRSTGGHSTPSYWLLIVLDGEEARAARRLEQQRSRRPAIRKVADSVFEVY